MARRDPIGFADLPVDAPATPMPDMGGVGGMM